MAIGITRTSPTRYPGGLTTVTSISPLRDLELPSPLHQVVLGWRYDDTPGFPTGNTPVTNADFTVTSVTSAGTASLNAASLWPPVHLLTTGTTANDQVVLQDKRTIFKNFLSLRKVIVGGSFRVTSTVANAGTAFGLFSGTSVAALGNDQFTFNSSGATLNFVNRNNGGTALTTAVSTAITINTLYGAIAVLDPLKSSVAIYFGQIDGLDMTMSSNTPNEIPAVASAIAVTTANIPDGTNAIQLGFGAQTTAGSAATVQFGPCFAVVM